MSNQAKHTQGTAKAIKVENKYHDREGQIVTVSTVVVGDHAVARCHRVEDGEFIAEAFNVAYETCMTPRQLAEELRSSEDALVYWQNKAHQFLAERGKAHAINAELLAALKACKRGLELCLPDSVSKQLKAVNAAIAKAEGGAS